MQLHLLKVFPFCVGEGAMFFNARQYLFPSLSQENAVFVLFTGGQQSSKHGSSPLLPLLL